MRTPASKSPSMIRRRKRAEPVTFVRSPTLTKLVKGVIASGSRPLKRETGSISGTARLEMLYGLGDGADVFRRRAAAAATMLTKPLCANSPR